MMSHEQPTAPVTPQQLPALDRPALSIKVFINGDESGVGAPVVIKRCPSMSVLLEQLSHLLG